MKSADNIYAKRAEELTDCNYDFRYASNLPKKLRIDYTNSSWKPKPCINTATSVYDKYNTCTYCPHFVEHPEKWGFVEVEDPKAGDMIVLFNSERAYHVGILVGNSILGPIMNHAAAGKGYIKHDYVIRFKMSSKVKDIKYYRYTKPAENS